MSRAVAGHLTGVQAPVGTILGPKEVTREYVVVIDTDDRGVTVGYATAEEIRATLTREPRSVAEHRIRQAFSAEAAA